MNYDTLDWEILDRLRRRFLDEAFGGGPYWESAEDLAQYDRTFGERIGWKWDAVLSELADRRWVPGGVAVLIDWGCGSGVAGRRVLHHLARAGALPGRVILHDRSARAVDFARDRLAEAFPGLPVTGAGTDPLPDLDPDALVVVSHVLNELPPSGRESLVAGVRRAGGVLWVEPGTRAVARDLQAVRDRLRDVLPPVLPCPHQGPCGLQAPGREADWCHHFASPPQECFVSGDWARFAARAGIDLRALPYSCLVATRPGWHPGVPAPAARRLGHARVLKGHVQLTACTADGVGGVDLQRRDDPDLHRAFKKGHGPATGDWIIG